MLCAVGFVKIKEFVMIPVDGVSGNGAISPTKSGKLIVWRYASYS
jgi:hypothetical protein